VQFWHKQAGTAYLSRAEHFKLFWTCLLAEQMDYAEAFRCPICGTIRTAPCLVIDACTVAMEALQVWDSVLRAKAAPRAAPALASLALGAGLAAPAAARVGPHRVGSAFTERVCITDAGIRRKLLRWSGELHFRAARARAKWEPLRRKVRILSAPRVRLMRVMA
jgi:hypothetical protein